MTDTPMPPQSSAPQPSQKETESGKTMAILSYIPVALVGLKITNHHDFAMQEVLYEFPSSQHAVSNMGGSGSGLQSSQNLLCITSRPLVKNHHWNIHGQDYTHLAFEP